MDIEKLLTTPAPSFSPSEAEQIALDLYGLSGKAAVLGSERDQNFHLVTNSDDQYVIKIANSSEAPEIIEMQVEALEYISGVDSDLPVPKAIRSKSGNVIEEIKAADNRKHSVRIVTYLPGLYPKGKYIGDDFYRQLGITLARTAIALRGFFHPAGNYDLLWDLKHAARLRDYLGYLDDQDHHEQSVYFLDRFESNVLPKIPKLRAQILHNDLVPDNILVAEDDYNRVVGIIDFGDLTHTCLIIDLATTIAASLRETGDPATVASQIVAGYNEIIQLEEEELRVLFDLVGTRLVMLNLIASWRVTIHQENHDYIMGGVESTWNVIKKWRRLDPEKVTRKFFRVCGHWEHAWSTRIHGASTDSLIARREKLLGPFAYLFYDQPLHIVRGEGVWLFDELNNRYLDAYNNVPQVGHCHPHVVNQIAKQARLLNTSTRYLHEYVLELAERITATLPDPLSVCTFVCTGSEANELAWTMSQLVTGNTGVLITEFSYHGSTGATGNFSTENLPDGSLANHIATFEPPISNTTWSKPDSGVQAAIQNLAENNHQPAMCILDTSFVSDGIFTSPKGYLKTVFDMTRAAGGLCVADEVQGGFGRFGEEFWGFEFDDVIPDIVTMGKPMGNGHPIAAVVTRPEIAEALAMDRGYFNTFGGNPVSCAAGLAVLDVMEKEGLQENALEVGEYLVERLENLRVKVPILGEIHGSGLLLGVEVLSETGKPDGKTAKKIMNRMRQDRILIGTTGKNSNILKIRPPLVFQKDHADLLLNGLIRAVDKK